MKDSTPLFMAPLGPARENVVTTPLLMLGPSLGTSAAALWTEVAELLAGQYDCFGFDLPGHGLSRRHEPVNSMPELAAALLAGVEQLQQKRGETGKPFFYAGVSVSGCIGLQLLLDAPNRIRAAAIINSAARIGQPEAWRERAALVMQKGTDALRESSRERWFGTGFVDARKEKANELLDSLTATDKSGYAGVCEALGGFDVRARLGEIATPTLAIGGSEDMATPPPQQQELVKGISGARIAALPGVGHLSPAEKPEAVASLLADFFKSV